MSLADTDVEEKNIHEQWCTCLQTGHEDESEVSAQPRHTMCAQGNARAVSAGASELRQTLQ